MSTTVFIECVSCGEYEELFDHEVETREAEREASRRGWTIRGYRRARRTRCPNCRKHGRTDTQAAREGKIGKRAGHYPMKVRHT